MSFGHYQTLGVSSAATHAELRSAYLRLARLHHPDLNPHDARAVEQFQRIQVAYELLSDPDRRRQYDRAPGLCPARPVVHAAARTVHPPFPPSPVGGAARFSGRQQDCGGWCHWRPEKSAISAGAVARSIIYSILGTLLLYVGLSRPTPPSAYHDLFRIAAARRPVPPRATAVTEHDPALDPASRGPRVMAPQRTAAQPSPTAPDDSASLPLGRDQRSSEPTAVAAVAAVVTTDTDSAAQGLPSSQEASRQPGARQPAVAGWQALLAGQTLFAPQEMTPPPAWDPVCSWKDVVRVDPVLVNGLWPGSADPPAERTIWEQAASTRDYDARAVAAVEPDPCQTIVATPPLRPSPVARSSVVAPALWEAAPAEKASAHWKRLQQLAYHPPDRPAREVRGASRAAWGAPWQRPSGATIAPAAATPVPWPPAPLVARERNTVKSALPATVSPPPGQKKSQNRARLASFF